MGKLKDNLQAAEIAVKTVDSFMGYFGGAQNKSDEIRQQAWKLHPDANNPLVYYSPGHMLSMHAATEKTLESVKASLKQKLVLIRDEFAQKFPNGPEPWTKQKLLDLAALARNQRAGQCTEQVAIAFEHLKNNGIKPLDFMIQEPRRLDHVFIVIGRNSSRESEWDLEKNPRWGDEAVVCDPWSREKTKRVYPTSKISEMMKLPYAVSTIFRWEGN